MEPSRQPAARIRDFRCQREVFYEQLMIEYLQQALVKDRIVCSL
jgi:hypothetical protein